VENSKVLVFVMVGGIQVPSKGSLEDVRRDMDVLHNRWFRIVHPGDGQEGLLYLPNVLMVTLVDEDKFQFVPPKIEIPSTTRIY